MTFSKEDHGSDFSGRCSPAAGGCDDQDSTQPAAGSISVGARKDNLAPSVPPGKTKTAPARK